MVATGMTRFAEAVAIMRRFFWCAFAVIIPNTLVALMSIRNGPAMLFIT